MSGSMVSMRRGLFGEGVGVVGWSVVKLVAAYLVVAVWCLFWGTAFSWGAVSAPSLRVHSIAFPSILPAGQAEVKYVAVLENVGGAPTSGEITLKDVLPAGLTATQAFVENSEAGECPVVGSEVECHFFESMVPSGFITVSMYVGVSGASGQLVNKVSVSGGGASGVSTEEVTRTGAEHETAPEGITDFGFEATGPAGEPVSQAGGHPSLLTATVLLNNLDAEKSAQGLTFREPFKPIQPPKDLVFYLPLGLLGNATVPTLCPQSEFEISFDKTGCPPSSRLGTALPMILSNVLAPTADPTREFGLYDVIPEKGYPAEFGFASENYTFMSYVSVVRRNGKYELRVSLPGVPAIAELTGLIATFNGDIKEPFLDQGEERVFDRGAFLTNPSYCGESSGDLEATFAMNTWVNPDPSLPIRASAPTFGGPLTGCGDEQFAAGINVRPQTTQADEPSGYQIGLEVPQAPNESFGVGTAPVRNVELALPAGTSISPGSANGLVACKATGPTGINIEGGESEETGADGLSHLAPGHCPQASQLGTVTATSPLLREELSGHLFVAEPECSPCSPTDAGEGKLFGVYLELQAPNSGIYIKLKGRTEINQATGQLTTVFENTPQFPFSDLTVSLTPGARSPIANSQACGAAVSEAKVQPWIEDSTAPVETSSSFNVDWDGAGGGCPASDPFSPVFLAETKSPQAGVFSPFDVVLKREDREQDVESLSTTLPEGLLANVNSVGRCPEPLASQASLTACPANSQIGTITAVIGSGSEPIYERGKVFLTTAYEGAPFGLSVVVPATAGPFNLGAVNARAKVVVNPVTAQVTAVSKPIQQSIDGVPLRIRVLNIEVNAHDFTLNPTGCSQTSVTGNVTSTAGASVNVSSPFAVSNCGQLPFGPQVVGSTEASSTKANGTGVSIKVSSPSTSGFGQAGVQKLVLSLPKQLPTRLSTLQQACRAVVFEANPAACPAASAVAMTTVHTPILGVPLTGPGYLVSFGASKFPDIVFVLQGEGITLKIDGQSFVSSSGVLTGTFASVPDAPFTSFESVFPKGPFSLLTSSRTTGKASASQCGETLTAPVTMVSHSGVELKQNANIAVAECKPSISLVKAKRSGGKLRVTVKNTAKGRVSIHGFGLKSLVKSGVGAGTHTFSVALSAAGRRAARAHRKIVVTAGLVVGKQTASAHRRVAL